ncbi:MAG: type IV secretory system conjugative DNA transfer family protein [Silvanigrellaceae bacterium]|nr:type IV secretory system conjugative DNA transfer family protein [Silvanigrellaceae bacterium]
MRMFNGFAALAFGFCIFKSLSPRLRKITQNGLKWIAVGCLVAVTFLTIWCAIFYQLIGIPLSLVRPDKIFWIITQTQALDIVTNLCLWCFPVTVMALIAASALAPIFEPPWRHLYGNAHWASRREIKKMGLLNDKGNVIVGYFAGNLLHYSLVNHLLVFAPSRSGKGVSVVIPNALNWRGSLLALDNKYEIFKYTSGFRAINHNQVYRFSPASIEYQTHRINPLDYIDRTNPCKRITDLHLILDILVASSGDENKMWAEEARSLALGLLLWLMQSPRLFALSELSSLVKSGNLDEFLTQVINDHTIADNLITIDPAAYLAIQNFLQKAPKEQSGVRSTLTSMLRLWEDPFICAATNFSDIDFREMRKTPITLYLSFGTDQISRLAPLINLIAQLFLNVMLAHLPGEDEPCKVLCLLDEINRFGRMDKLKDGFGDLAGYGVHLIPIIQNLGQFYSIYGGRDSTDIFFQNTDLKIGFRQNAPTDKEFLSKELGNRTVRIKNRSYGTNKEGSNYSESLIERPLLSPAEVGRFSLKKQMIITGNGVIKCKKIIYYKDKRFKKKLLPAITIPTINPQFPVIDVRKEPVAEAISNNSNNKTDTASAIGKAIGESLAPLVRAIAKERSHSNPLPIDSNSHEYLNQLADSFKEEEFTS